MDSLRWPSYGISKALTGLEIGGNILDVIEDGDCIGCCGELPLPPIMPPFDGVSLTVPPNYCYMILFRLVVCRDETS